ncbi:phosphopentomutase [Aeromonas sobria]|uniref:phosphopentomutase n=1 Tax=Aeromonas sobria TaxID=646 RepID=UPI00111A8968|nr:phosphopentomutase [Aeromonas sobria]TNJ20967.1 phosphopentomutase [Aeromonas sobria]
MARFIVVVLDGFGIGEMPDVLTDRPQDHGANTARNLIEHFSDKHLPTLARLGLLNSVYSANSVMQISETANWGRSMLAHEGCDTFMGHQEIMGTKPRSPLQAPFSTYIDEIEAGLIAEGYQVNRIYRDALALLEVNNCVLIGDNLEAELGQVYNITANLNLISFDDVVQIGRVVRKYNEAGRNIAFGGLVDSMDEIYSAIETKTDKNGDKKFIGVNAPRSGAYNNGFKVIHLGYGVDPSTQVPHCLNKIGITTFLYGKVADIVENEHGTSYPGVVDTDTLFDLLQQDVEREDNAFFCLNVQETDLSGHQQNAERYWNTLEKADAGLSNIIAAMSINDILIVMADHGNDPFIGHSLHTREMVPILLYSHKLKGLELGVRDTLSDVGASVAYFFNAPMPEFGSPIRLAFDNI